MKDLIVLAADKDIEITVQTLLSQRPAAFGARAITFDVRVHPQHDSGCFHRSHDFLRPLHRQYHRGLVIFDYDGCGSGHLRRETENQVERRLAANGWDGRCACVVIEPELEIWVWTDSPHVPTAIGWTQEVSVRDWLAERGLWRHDSHKPEPPKEALERVLRAIGRPRSAALYGDLAARVSLAHCVDPAFTKLRTTVAAWFPAPSIAS